MLASHMTRPAPSHTRRHTVTACASLLVDCHRCQVHDLKEPAATCDSLLDMAVRLARCGLIHGDLNEFNVMVDKQDRLTLIDFPQMVSTAHSDAEW